MMFGKKNHNESLHSPVMSFMRPQYCYVPLRCSTVYSTLRLIAVAVSGTIWRGCHGVETHEKNDMLIFHLTVNCYLL